ncbi:NUDIX hydrolase [Xinfangfangia sp. D13-10-4-6]|uniref:NUDIX hydrolase n=1 Tax=Pseudogemmobacter hezensis TaxID=2737662 RepID=UPI0015518562|nr:NUDIX hydrolase [Pseudogemmobacter hezensis]NPD17556.1 NUDIX hydrolase [Pseudogemmobacter hezensis]
MTLIPRLAALAVLPHEGRVLLVRRHNPPDPGLWGYPGGKVEAGETVSAAALRELHEETGIRAAAITPLPGLDVILRDASGGLLWHYHLVPVMCRYLGGEALAGDDADEAAWLPYERVLSRDLPMSADVDTVLSAALKHQG